MRKESLSATTPPIDGDPDIGEINEIVGFHIRLAYGAAYRHFSENCSELELTQKQVAVLWLIGDSPDIAQTDLARRMRMDRATTMAIVNRLQERSLLVRGKSASDGRKQTLNLTPAGQSILVIAKDAIRAHEAWLKARFTPTEVATLIELLTRIHQ